MTLKFDDVTWHDTEITAIVVNRESPGKNDVVTFELGNDTDGTMVAKFLKAWQMTCSLNFGIVCKETIRTAICLDRHEKLDALVTKWKRVGLNLAGLKIFVFETNSTASNIEIIAEDMLITRRANS